MAEMVSIRHGTIPIQKIISVACRNFMAFDNLRTFEFDEIVNTIIGGNGSGKSTLITIIMQALSRDVTRPWDGRRFQNDDSKESLIEIKFIADDKEHYLRRVLLGEKIPIPHNLSSSKGFEEEEIIAISDAQQCLDECPKCKSEIPFGTLILVTENFRLIPANCCSQVIWLKEKDSEEKEDWA